MGSATDRAIARSAWIFRKIWRQLHTFTPFLTVLSSHCVQSKRIRRWTCAATFLASLASFSVRQILAAYLLFAAMFLIAALAIGAFIALDYMLDLGIGWVLSEGRAAFSVVHQFLSVSAPVRVSTKERSAHAFYQGSQLLPK